MGLLKSLQNRVQYGHFKHNKIIAQSVGESEKIYQTFSLIDDKVFTEFEIETHS